MANITTTNIDNGPIVLQEDLSEDGLVTFAGADVFAPGTILARHTGTLNWQLYVKGGSSNGNGVPQGVLSYELEADGAGDLPARIITAGKLNKRRLIIDADGDDSNIDATVTDLLREHGLLAEDVQQLSRFDNPQPSEVDS